MRIRRSVSLSDESFGISFRTLKGGLVLLAQDNTLNYTLIQVIKLVHFIELLLYCKKIIHYKKYHVELTLHTIMI